MIFFGSGVILVVRQESGSTPEEVGEKLLSKFSPTLYWKCWRKEMKQRKREAYSNIT